MLMTGKFRIAGTFSRETEFRLGIQWKAGVIYTEGTAYAKSLQLLRLGDFKNLRFQSGWGTLSEELCVQR